MTSQVPFDRFLARLLPLADAVMIIMLSRPATGTLRDTRVTLVTIYLAVAVAVTSLALAMLALLLALGGASILWWPASVVLLALFVGSADLGAYGAWQRYLSRGDS